MGVRQWDRWPDPNPNLDLDAARAPGKPTSTATNPLHQRPMQPPRRIDSVSCKLLKAMRELWDLLLMGDGRESASFHSIMHLIHGYRQEAQKAFGEILQQEEGQWSLQLWANFHEIALMNTTAAEQAYRQIEYLDALRAEKSYSGTASSGRSVYQVQGFPPRVSLFVSWIDSQKRCEHD